MTELRTVARPVFRKDAWDKVTGQALYVDDVPVDDLLYGAVLRSPHHHARIVGLDTQAAIATDGVVAVLTADDVLGSRTFGPLVQDRAVLAFDVVRHMGEPVALVIARSKLAAQRALRAIRVKYKELPAVFDPVKALKPNAPQVHPSGNLLTEYDYGRGDVEAGFAEADVIVEETFRVPRISPAYLEPEAATAVWQADGTLKVWVSSQKPFEDRHSIAQVLALPEEGIHVVVATVGGAFGGREDSGLQILAALGAWATQGAVRLVNTREESIQAHPKRHAAVLHYKMGAKRDGTLVALSADVHLATGAYASYGPAVGGLLSEMAPGPYRTPNVRVITRVVYTNGPFAGAMRGFGSPQPHFATESMMDVLAAELGMDPIEFRRKNVWRQGDHTPTGVLLREAPTLEACLDHAAEARERLRAVEPTPGKLSGVGMALGLQSMGLGFRVPDDCTNRIEWLPDGRVLLHIGTPDMGQGLITVAAQMAAEGLGLDYDSVEVADIDTSISPYGGVSCASRMTYIVGNASLMASREAIKALLDYAARALGVRRKGLHYERGRVYQRDTEDSEGIAAAEFVSRAAEEGRVLSGEATFSFPHPPDIPDHLPVGMPHVMFCYAAQVARVEVDPDLGTVEVKEVVAIHDVGRAISPTGVEGQIEGGVVMGMGYALQEEVRLKDDGTWSDGFTEYLLPTTLDSPLITCVILEQPEPSGPFGAKGVGEIGLVPVAPAIANAVAEATGKRVTAIPVRPEMLVGG
jgi:CO/xanthine dehydrogenase Mo-binding subunit